MNNKNIDLSTLARKFDSVDTTVTGPESASNGKQYYKAQFQENTASNGGYLAQSRAYTKLFFEDSHSLVFRACEKAVENGTPLKIMAARVFIPTDKDFYIVDREGNKMKKNNGDYRKATGITMFLLPDENPLTIFAAACNAITERDGWVKENVADEDLDLEEEVPETPKSNASNARPGKK
jgi:hypothetical protein